MPRRYNPMPRPDAADRVSTTLLDKIDPQPTHVPELVVATRQARLAVDGADLAEDAAQHAVDEIRGGARIGVRTADRLRDDLVDQIALQQIRPRQFQRL